MRSRSAVRRFLERVRNQTGSQQAIADLVGRWKGKELSHQAVGQWLGGKTDPAAWILFALAEELRLPLNEFVAGQSWEERLATAERALTAAERQLAVLRAWALTQGMQATGEQMTSDQ